MKNPHKTIALQGEDGVRKYYSAKIYNTIYIVHVEMVCTHEKKRIISCLFANDQRNIWGHFKSLGPLTVIQIKKWNLIIFDEMPDKCQGLCWEH